MSERYKVEFRIFPGRGHQVVDTATGLNIGAPYAVKQLADDHARQLNGGKR